MAAETPPGLPVPAADTAPLPAPEVERHRASAGSYARASLSPNTLRAYRADWDRFAGFCAAHGLIALPAEAETVAAFLAAEADAGRKASTVTRRLAAIAFRHEMAGHPAPSAQGLPDARALRQTLAGIRRTLGTAPDQATPLLAADMIRIVERISDDDDPLNRRDRALIALGFAGAFRRSELAALQVEDLTFRGEDLLVRVRRSKTDPEGKGREKGIKAGTRVCPVRLLKAWLSGQGIVAGPVFPRIRVPPANRHSTRPPAPVVTGTAIDGQSVRLVLQRRAAAAGYAADDFTGHSLRAGFLTSGAEAGADTLKLMEVSLHASVQTVAGYVRRANLLKDHAAEGLY